MVDRILVPLDGSKFAEWALPSAVAMARHSGAAIRLLSVIERPPIFAFRDENDPDRRTAEAYLASVADRVLLLCPGTVDFAVREGWVVPEIEAEAEEWGADLVVMSTHGRAGLARIWKGSVAARCVEGGRCPVLLVRPSTEENLDTAEPPRVARVVVPLDGSEQAERALEAAASLARLFGVHVLLLSVRAGQAAQGYSEEADEKRDPGRAAALEYLRKHVVGLRRSGIDSYGMMLFEPHPAETIADRVYGDLVVMATAGHDRPGRTLFGTVTDKVVRNAECGVMVIPPARSEALATSA